jgi:hypothetical protein
LNSILWIECTVILTLVHSHRISQVSQPLSISLKHLNLVKTRERKKLSKSRKISRDMEWSGFNLRHFKLRLLWAYSPLILIELKSIMIQFMDVKHFSCSQVHIYLFFSLTNGNKFTSGTKENLLCNLDKVFKVSTWEEIG